MSLRTAIWSARPPIYRGLCMSIVIAVFGFIGVCLHSQLLFESCRESRERMARETVFDDIHSREERP